jgi:hypothetical protein
LHFIQLQKLPAMAVAEVIEKLQVIGPDASTLNTRHDRSQPSVGVEIDTNTIRFLANEEELQKIEELLLKLGEGPNPPVPQQEVPSKSKFRYLHISHVFTTNKY